MLIVVPVSSHDADLVEDFCGVLQFLGPYPTREVLVVARPSDKDHALKVAEGLSSSFAKVSVHIFRDNGPHGWPQGPNFYWHSTISYLDSISNTSPWFWMELDTTPVDVGWIDKLADEYLYSGKPFLGMFQNSPPRKTEVGGGTKMEYITHLVGVAVYPPDMAKYKTWKSCIDIPLAFDVLCGGEILPKSKPSKIMQHCFRTWFYKCTDMGLCGIDTTFKKEGEKFGNPIRQGVYLVHGCTDGSLARLIMNKPWYGTSVSLGHQFVPCYLHVPKCGGTYTREALQLAFSIYCYSNGALDYKIFSVFMDNQKSPHLIVFAMSLRSMLHESRKAYVDVTMPELEMALKTEGVDIFAVIVTSASMLGNSHLNLRTVESLSDKPFKYLMSYREPLHRCVSMYFEIKKQELQLPVFVDGNELSVRDFVAYFNSDFCEYNWTALFISKIFDIPIEDVENYAKAHITMYDTSLAAAGLHHTLDRIYSNKYISSYLLEGGYIENILHRNSSSENKTKYLSAISNEEMDTFMSKNSYDQILYDNCVRKANDELPKPKGYNHNVICYYEQFDNKFSRDSEQFLEIWKRSWENRGWNPIILGEKDAKQNPLYARIDIDYPDSNFYKTDNRNWRYHRSCYRRLLAYCQYVRINGATLYADYDVINYSFTPDILNYMQEDSVLKSERCAVYLGQRGLNDIEQAINRFDKDPGEISNCWSDRNSSSDMHVIARFTTVFKTITCNLITKECSEKNRTYYCQNAAQDGYMDSPLVHYDGGTRGRNIPEEYKELPRAELVQKLRPT